MVCSDSFLCRVCFSLLDDGVVFRCGHSFCKKCIDKSLEQATKCPSCQYTPLRNPPYTPNYQLRSIIEDMLREDPYFGLSQDDVFRKGQVFYKTTQYHEAFKLFRRAADAGNDRAMFMLAFCLDNGHGVGHDLQEALSWHQEAAEAGHLDAIQT
ncbi:hypothetical protein P9112_009763 [Eukaryota sp. TZLM1-RC]